MEHIAEAIYIALNREVHIFEISALGGGCINNSSKVKTSEGLFFVKWNLADRFPVIFESEAKGLKMLAKSGTIKVPAVIGEGIVGNKAFLVLEYVNSGKMRADFWDIFASGLAGLHKHSNDRFGLDHQNYIGSLTQKNTFHTDWISFFIENRLEVQLRLAIDSGKAGKDLSKALNRIYPRLVDFFPYEPPALLHGDLWNGNFMVAADGNPLLIDPSVYFGHRYIDLGMSLLFGGFDPAFYQSYNEYYPLDKDWKKGAEIANLYPLLVHVNLFGGGYLGRVMDRLMI
jgi:protein-ribulosamine 3-kinase